MASAAPPPRCTLVQRQLQPGPRAARLQVGRGFLFKQRATKCTTELRAGLITFLMVHCPRGSAAAGAAAAGG